MPLNANQVSLALAYHRWSEEIDMHQEGLRPLAPMLKVNWSPAGELINLNHLIEDVCSLLTAPGVGQAAVDLDLAADLPLIEGDYRLVRRLLINTVKELDGKIFLESRRIHLDWDYLTDNFPGGDLPVGNYVVIKVVHANPTNIREFGARSQFLFPCTSIEPSHGGPAAMDERQRGYGRIWLYLKVEPADKDPQSACFTTSGLLCPKSKVHSRHSSSPIGAPRRTERSDIADSFSVCG